ncbi:TetR/AcrR family transcriptional regulator [Biostraticola tofi]|uniref:TetR family transcriptional regulator n=1 Tax=Biostraticola tofi TaxID=466109 RepID=A0A4R3Z7D5_9GAMM|nr:TetR/AcrR family transcriptional regulator [Biostraticola tofi]TCW00121.1 TetR family transcriptional regulator [Biostraticola tofi]
MARASKQQMALNRHAIVATSSRLFRAQGLNGVSVNDLMAAVGLTHGGFYGHFASKDQLAAIACRQALDDSRARWQSACRQPDQDNLGNLAAFYLSAAHRDNIDDGCAITALASDVARESEDKPVRAVYIDGVKSMLARLESFSNNDNQPEERQQALARLALLVGSLTLARATAGDPLSDAFLAAARQSLLKEQAKPGDTPRHQE